MKWMVAILLFYYIWMLYLTHHNIFENTLFLNSKSLKNGLFYFVLLSIISGANWVFEILKWQVLIGNLRKISFYRAALQVLISHSFSLVTPFKTGDFVAKSVFYEKKYWLNIWILNAAGHFFQLVTTVLFGILGVSFLWPFSKIVFSDIMMKKGLALIGGLIFLYLIYFLKNQIRMFLKSKKFLISKNTLLKTFIFSVARYLIFSHQFYLILVLMGVNYSYFMIMPIIFGVYLLSAAVPFFALFDFALKGSVAVVLFGNLGMEQSSIFATTTLMWFLNFFLPALFGLSFFLIFKKKNLLLKPVEI